MEKADVLAALDLAIESIQGLANHDIVPAQHACWYSVHGDENELYCSLCSGCIEMNGYYDEPPDICPDCGAKMDAGEEEEAAKWEDEK